MPANPMSEVIQRLRGGLPAGADLTDGQLLECFVSCRETAALEALVHRHGSMVWGVCRRILQNHHDAEDAFQATFLVLARKAASIFPRTKVGNWLHGVAHQTALKARALRIRRRGLEQLVTEMPEPATDEQDPQSDLQAVLDQELSRLPEKYRMVIVLCELEGRTVRESAQELGCPEGTVASRLARARAMLARRLTRRGVTLSALAAVLTGEAVSASVPTSVVSSTIQAVLLAAAGQAAGLISVKVADLSEGVLKSMLLTKLKNVVVGLLLVVALAGGAGVIYRTQAAEQRQARGLVEKRVNAAPAPEKRAEKPPEPLPANIVATWEKAGFQSGWMSRSALGISMFHSEKHYAEDVPAFIAMKEWKPGVLRELPVPGRAFGLHLAFTNPTIAALKELAALQQLQVLSLQSTKVTDADLKELPGLEQLQSLNLIDTAVTDAGMKELTGLKQLRMLEIGGTAITDAGVKELTALKQLQSLSLYNTEVTDEGVRELVTLKQLQKLDLSCNAVTDAGLRELAALKQL
jgi:RNA polymerase sigma factor (sigma-70 family)